MKDYIVSDYKKHAMIKTYLNTHPTDKNKIKNIYHCHTRIIKATGIVPSVMILHCEETEENLLYGLTTCRSAWSCPICTAKVLAQKGNDIACAIDAMATWYKQKAIMITFTIPHYKYMTCQQTYNQLLATWRRFSRGGIRAHNATKVKILKDGTKQRKTKGTNPYGKFRQDLSITHNLRAYEFTWGKNGWHPHIHALYWVPTENWNKIMGYEQSLIDHWWHCAKAEALKTLNQKYPNKKERNEKYVNKMYADNKKVSTDKTDNQHKTLYISTDKEGRPLVQKSSHYVAGFTTFDGKKEWSANKELTAGTRIKTAREGHLTPFQMLEKAEEETDQNKKSFWLKLFVEYATTTAGHRRFDFSHQKIKTINIPTLTEIIRKWKETNQYMESFKKKLSDRGKRTLKIICWFNEQNWLQLCLISHTINPLILSEVLSRAPNVEAIQEYLSQYEIKVETKTHPHKELFEKQILGLSTEARKILKCA